MVVINKNNFLLNNFQQVFLIFCLALLFTSNALARSNATWVVDPHKVGSDIPEKGSSLFDKLYSKRLEDGRVVYQLPNNFSDLLSDLQSKLKDPEQMRVLLFPLGRSLQREAALGKLKFKDLKRKELRAFKRLKNWRLINLFESELLAKYIEPFFKYPRIVIGVDSEFKNRYSKLGLVKRRLYFGFTKKSNILEVISYNEELGRFEFQIVENFNTDQQQRVVYKNRALCLGCHQNHAPHFARGEWKESNAGIPIVQDLLIKHLDREPGDDEQHYFGMKIRTGRDTAQQFFNMTNKANDFSLYQKIWSDACKTSACRASATQLMLLYRLTNRSSVFNQSELYQNVYREELKKNWPWKNGLKTPNPALEFRDPLFVKRAAGFLSENLNQKIAKFLNFVSSEKNPAAFRGSKKHSSAFGVQKGLELAAYNVDQELRSNKMIKGLANEFLTEEDILNIDQELYSTRGVQKERLTFQCSYEFYKRGVATKLNVYNCDNGGKQYLSKPIDYSKKSRVYLSKKSSILTPMNGSLHYRLKNGNAIESLKLTKLGKNTARIQLTIRSDFQVLRNAINLMETASHLKLGEYNSLAQSVFQRKLILKDIYSHLGISVHKLQKIQTPKKELDQKISEEAVGIADDLRGADLFKNKCSRCHNSQDTFFSAFIREDGGKSIADNLEQCAPRIYARLMMWDLDQQKSKSSGIASYPEPMPLNGKLTSLELANLRKDIRIVMRDSSLSANEDLLEQGFLELQPHEINYKDLPICPDP